MTEQIKCQLEENGYDFAVAVATQSEIKNGAACGQLSIIQPNEPIRLRHTKVI